MVVTILAFGLAFGFLWIVIGTCRFGIIGLIGSGGLWCCGCWGGFYVDTPATDCHLGQQLGRNHRYQPPEGFLTDTSPAELCVRWRSGCRLCSISVMRRCCYCICHCYLALYLASPLNGVAGVWVASSTAFLHWLHWWAGSGMPMWLLAWVLSDCSSRRLFANVHHPSNHSKPRLLIWLMIWVIRGSGRYRTRVGVVCLTLVVAAALITGYRRDGRG